MKNMALSINVRKYFVHALKGLGMYHTRMVHGRLVEMTEQEIEALLLDPAYTPIMLYRDIEFSMVEQFKQDSDNSKYLQKKTAFDRKTVDSMIIEQVKDSDVLTSEEKRDNYLYNIVNRVQNDGTIENIINTLYAGVAEQDLYNNEKDEALAFWDEIHFADFKDWLEHDRSGNYHYNDIKFADWLRNGICDYQHPYSRALKQYRIEKVKINLFNETLKIYGGNNGDAVRTFLNTKIPSKEGLSRLPETERAKMEAFWQKLEANPTLLQNSKEFCRNRCDAYGLSNPDAEFCMTDVLAAAGGTAAQLITFFQTRSSDQDAQQKADPKNSGVTKENKIGNLMGKLGRAAVKSATGGTGAAVSFDGNLGPKKGKKGPWRGLATLSDRIMNWLTKDMYANIPVIGFVMAMMERLGYGDFSPRTAKVTDEKGDLTQAWKTDYEPISNTYKNENGELNEAGEFINKTKARLLADKVLLAEKIAQIKDYDASVDLEIEKQEVEYLEKRIKTANGILKEQIPTNPNSPVLNNQKYFQMLERQIIDKENCHGIKNKEDLDKILNFDVDQTPNVFMEKALIKFESIVKKTNLTPAQEDAKRSMAVDIFNLRTKYENGEISATDLDNMAQRFVESNSFGKMINNLHTLSAQGKQKLEDSKPIGAPKPVLDSSKDYAISADQAAEGIDIFVQCDLIENAKHEEYNRHKSEQYHEQFMNEALMER